MSYIKYYKFYVIVKIQLTGINSFELHPPSHTPSHIMRARVYLFFTVPDIFTVCVCVACIID